MSTDAGFEWLDEPRGFVLLRLSGPIALSAGAALVADAIARATALDYRGLVVDIRDVEGLAPPGVGARHKIARLWADVAGPHLRLAMVTPPDFIDPERFATIAAGNFGLVANVFETQAEALYWLRSDTLLDL